MNDTRTHTDEVSQQAGEALDTSKDSPGQGQQVPKAGEALDTSKDSPGQGEEPQAGEQIVTAANVITVVRLLLVPLAFSVLITGDHDLLAFALFAIAAASDFVDGQIARRTNTVTELGKTIDPLVDRFLIAAGVIGLYTVGRLPLWMLFVLIGRDAFLLLGLSILKKLRAYRLDVLFVGKATTMVLLFGFSGLIANLPILEGLAWTHSLAFPGFADGAYCFWIWFVYVGVVLSLITMVCYIFSGVRALRVGREAR